MEYLDDDRPRIVIDNGWLVGGVGLAMSTDGACRIADRGEEWLLAQGEAERAAKEAGEWYRKYEIARGDTREIAHQAYLTALENSRLANEAARVNPNMALDVGAGVLEAMVGVALIPVAARMISDKLTERYRRASPEEKIDMRSHE